jgi:hypothetical protein
MENVTATTMADTEIFAINNPLFAPGVEDLVSHELAHSWFGNLVTCRIGRSFGSMKDSRHSWKRSFVNRATDDANYLIKVKRDAEIFITDDAVNPKRNGLYNQTPGMS